MLHDAIHSSCVISMQGDGDFGRVGRSGACTAQFVGGDSTFNK